MPLMLLTLSLLKINASQSDELIEVVETVAGASGLIEMVRMVPQDLRNGRIRLPITVCSKHNLSFKTIYDKNTGVPSNDLFDAVLE